ncbi:DUF3307 domain-containing protein [Streptomyces racemochromogenes]|uniref:DUF3307 domain-containing protein n=1 Tax=Streptomyces racemochromogenes TaxID=67353 RepID=UPI0031E56285
MFATIFVLLYVGHLLADYPFQTDHQAKHKAGCDRTGWTANIAHAATHVLLCGAALGLGALLLDDVTLSASPTAAALLWIGATHGFIDRRWPVARWMKLARQEGWAQHGGAAHVDQTAHVSALLLAALALAA